jgi:hypothetical protein
MLLSVPQTQNIWPSCSVVSDVVHLGRRAFLACHIGLHQRTIMLPDPWRTCSRHLGASEFLFTGVLGNVLLHSPGNYVANALANARITKAWVKLVARKGSCNCKNA